jgi:hypothetical protein
MPVLNTVGALTTFKIADTNVFWATTFTYPTYRPGFSGYITASNNSIVLGGAIYTNIATSGFPGFVRISSGSDTIPSLNYTAFFGSNANSTGSVFALLYDSVNDRNIMVGRQKANRSNNIVDCGMIRVVNSNNSIYSSFLDPPETISPLNTSRSFDNAVLDSHGNIIITGLFAESSPMSSSGYFVGSYTQTGTKNWTKKFAGFPNNPIQLEGILPDNSTILVSGTGNASAGYNTTVAILNSSGTSFNNQFTFTELYGGVGSIDTSNNNIYFSGANSTQGKFVKFNNSNNSVSWTKTTSLPNSVSSSAFYNGNVYVSILDTSFTANSYLNKIVSFNANTGVVNWKNEYRFYGTGIYAFNTGSGLGLTANSEGLFAINSLYKSGNTIIGGQALIKFPLDGSIPGAGASSGSAVYPLINSGANTLMLSLRPSTISFGTGSVGITSSNVSLVNANSLATISSNITANTTQTYTYNQGILK